MVDRHGPGESHSGYITDMDLFLGVYDLMALCLLGWRLSMSKLIPLSSMSQRFSISGSPGALPWLICFLALSTSNTVNSVSVIPRL